MKKVSLIVPVYNSEKYLEECIQSILNQTYSCLEVILVDDKSTDQSLRIAKKYQSNGSIILLENDKNRGVGYSRNRGMEISTGDYIMFADSDDVLTPVMVEYLVNALEKGNTDIAMCGYHSFFKHADEDISSFKGNFQIIDLEKDPGFLEDSEGYCWNKIYRKSLFCKLHFPEGMQYEDIPVSYPIMIESRYISFINEPLYQYRFNVHGITKKNKKIPNRGLLDLYSSALVLDKNYQLVRRNELLDETMREIGHSIILIGALDSANWISMKNRKRVSQLFLQLANQKYGYQSCQENPYVARKSARKKHYAIRMFYVQRCIEKKNYGLVKNSEEIVRNIETYIDEYVNSKYDKCKVMKKG